MAIRKQGDGVQSQGQAKGFGVLATSLRGAGARIVANILDALSQDQGTASAEQDGTDPTVINLTDVTAHDIPTFTGTLTNIVLVPFTYPDVGASWEMGDQVIEDRFSGWDFSYLKGSSVLGISTWDGDVSTQESGPRQQTDASVQVKVNFVPDHGKVLVTVFALKFNAAQV
jgi:hypothetical protein